MVEPTLAGLTALDMPTHVDHAHLSVADLTMVSSWYREILGLRLIETSQHGHTLGVAGLPLLTLTEAKDAVPQPRNAPGLFHTAFLVPDRAALAAWLAHAVQAGVPLQGASDHLVSEAIYLADPEGNGIEVYRDRPRTDWTYLQDGMVKMATERLDLQALYDEADKGPWGGMQPGTAIGHIHLQVSDIPGANHFFRDVLGLDLMATYPGASFFASGRYHHHVAANIWNSRHASPRPAGMAGLADYTLHVSSPDRLDQALAGLERLEIPVTRIGQSVSLTDPWGIGLRLSA
ncbi:VOC family protein [Rhizobium sp. YIM 134829]|uniref:VOC family protein n=1 Tax=Rhizobium sp. YIM 134829 TaxID=3390453 RepID=UPI00397CA015